MTFSRLIIFLFSIGTLFGFASSDPLKESATSIETIQFTPPPNWRTADQTALPNEVQLMVVGKGLHEFPPSITLATEAYSGTVKSYLKIVKQLNAAKGYEWKDLGTIQTKAGNASLSQTDSQSEWGNIRMMHVILKKNETIYIITATAKREEFPTFYQQIFSAFRSLHFSTNTFEKQP